VTELAGALQYLHANRVVHGSIRPVCYELLVGFPVKLKSTQEAIFVDEDGVPLLAYTPLMVGQFVVLVDAYTAPELHQDEGTAIPTTASDVYSLGGVIHWVIRIFICASTIPIWFFRYVWVNTPPYPLQI
jgi:serine/threonine protein kinase